MTTRFLGGGVGLVLGIALMSPLGLASGQRASLKIVVLEGEDAVNVIQQKTAVAPVVEVRDRNNQPVGGATVTFTIRSARSATFAGGSQTVTVTTDAVGRATASAINPLGTGGYQIQVAAAFEGQAAGAAGDADQPHHSNDANPESDANANAHSCANTNVHLDLLDAQ